MYLTTEIQKLNYKQMKTDYKIAFKLNDGYNNHHCLSDIIQVYEDKSRDLYLRNLINCRQHNQFAKIMYKTKCMIEQIKEGLKHQYDDDNDDDY